MIAIPRHHDVEIRVLCAVLSRPTVLASAPELEPEDFDDPTNRLLWVAIRNVEQLGLPGSAAELRLCCAEWLTDQPGAARMNSYGMLAAELAGDFSHVMNGQRPVISRRVMDAEEISTDASVRERLRADVTVLRFARRARAQLAEQQAAAARRLQS